MARWLYLSLVFTVLGSSHSLACGKHSEGATIAFNAGMKDHLKNCGGKIYSKCDDSQGVNQLTIFEEARIYASSSQRKLLVVFGADWCPACRSFDKEWKSDKNKEIVSLIEREYLMVKIEGTMKSAKKLAKKLKVSVLGFPKAFVVDPESLKEELGFFPSSYLGKRFSKIKDTLFLKENEQLKPSPFYGSASSELVEKEIGIVEGFGKSNWAPGKGMASRLINQGAAMFHMFHYVDAYRSFRTAEAKDPSNPYAYIGQVISGFKLSWKNGPYLAQRALEKMEEAAQVQSSVDKAWVDFAYSFYKAHSIKYRSDPNRVVPSMTEAYENLKKLAPEDVEVLTLVGFLVNPRGRDNLEKAHRLDPEHAGAVHYLTHYWELTNKHDTTLGYAEKLAELAPSSAHAQHMLGHILPKFGRWEESLGQFLKADRIHKEWAEKYKVQEKEDWHYGHNLDLMGVVLAMLGRFDQASDVLLEASKHDGRGVATFFDYLMATGSASFGVELIKKMSNSNEEAKKYFKVHRLKSELLAGQISIGSIKKNFGFLEKERGGKYLYKVLELFANPNTDNATLEAECKSYIDKHLKRKHGFDSWKRGSLRRYIFTSCFTKQGVRKWLNP